MQISLSALILALLSATAVLGDDNSGNRGATAVDLDGALKKATVVNGHLVDIPVASVENDNEETGSSGVNVDSGPGNHAHNQGGAKQGPSSGH
ncbi:hypothetical protein BJV82DRAFT_590063 [Fennellomyces sp. T-0311]|nr:hypothetical protein BJV82DRAFT_590063 [Fennellomyces sp. T-0311]